MGGSLIFNNDLTIKNDVLNHLAEIFQQSPEICAIVIGGGKIAREFIKSARYFNADEALCDEFGIEVSRLNAKLLQTAIGQKSFPKIITNLQEAREGALWEKILIAGGFVPGQSTTSVTFELAEALHATDIIILTDVDGIYDKDPDKYKDAKKFDSITIHELEKIIYGEGGESQSAAGEYRIFDAISIQIFKRSKINVRLTNGQNFDSLKQLLIEKSYNSNIGTKIIPM
jgi:uridylate kinase